MKNLNSENEIVQSILHMVVNSGEQSNYPIKTQECLHTLAWEFFKGSLPAARKYIDALLVTEVYEHMDEYSCVVTPDADQLIYEFQSTLTGYINTVLK